MTRNHKSQNERDETNSPDSTASTQIRIGKYKDSRFWGIWIGDQLIAVTVYKKGALAIEALVCKPDNQPQAVDEH